MLLESGDPVASETLLNAEERRAARKSLTARQRVLFEASIKGRVHRLNMSHAKETAALKLELERLRQEVANLRAENAALQAELSEWEGEYDEDNDPMSELQEGYNGWRSQMLG